MFAGIIIAVALVSNIGVTIRQFGRLNAAAAILLVPYLVFAGFALYLNAGFWWLNH